MPSKPLGSNSAENRIMKGNNKKQDPYDISHNDGAVKVKCTTLSAVPMTVQLVAGNTMHAKEPTQSVNKDSKSVDDKAASDKKMGLKSNEIQDNQ